MRLLVLFHQLIRRRKPFEWDTMSFSCLLLLLFNLKWIKGRSAEKIIERTISRSIVGIAKWKCIPNISKYLCGQMLSIHFSAYNINKPPCIVVYSYSVHTHLLLHTNILNFFLVVVRFSVVVINMQTRLHPTTACWVFFSVFLNFFQK